MNNPVQEQLDGFKEQAAAAGFSGNGLIDVQPDKGVIRIKVNIDSAENLPGFITQFSQMISMMLQGLNVSVKTHIAKKE